jgi:hypothetical protein
MMQTPIRKKKDLAAMAYYCATAFTSGKRALAK